MFAKGVEPPAVGGDDAESAGAVDQNSKIVRAALGGLENPDGVIEKSAHEQPYRTLGKIFEKSGARGLRLARRHRDTEDGRGEDS
jgi:hypothetical protein